MESSPLLKLHFEYDVEFASAYLTKKDKMGYEESILLCDKLRHDDCEDLEYTMSTVLAVMEKVINEYS